MNVRPAKSFDIPEMMRIAEVSSGAAAWTRTQYEQIFSSSRHIIRIFEERGALVGFVVAAWVGSEVEIENIAVLREFRRRSVATELLRHVLTEAAAIGCSSVILEVRHSNLLARKFYEKQGFVEEGQRPSYYSDPEENAVLYRKNLAVATPEKA